MEVKKNPQADLERHKSTFTQIGLVVVLGFMLIAFNWTTKERSVGDLGVVVAIDLEEEMIATEREEEPEPPPPPQEQQQQDVIEELIVVENTEDVASIDIDTEATEHTMITQTEIKVQAEEIVEDEPEIFLVVEEQPEFPGGYEEMMKYLHSNTKYPQIAKENGISGTVWINFVIDSKGKITKIKVARSVDPVLDAEAVRVVQSMPQWKPGKQSGRAVHVNFSLPVKFILQ
ncbi:MAG TPA: energy transducer TonB [Salinivirgaceae bacterium]|nr:energy transducer TonB [Salinivirgaceae bacterium]